MIAVKNIIIITNKLDGEEGKFVVKYLGNTDMTNRFPIMWFCVSIGVGRVKRLEENIVYCYRSR